MGIGTATNTKLEPGSLGRAERGEFQSSQDLTQTLPSPHALPSLNITGTLGNSSISEMSVNNGPVFTELQRPETQYQTNSPLQCLFAYKIVWASKYTYVTQYSFQCHSNVCTRDGEVGKTEGWSSNRMLGRGGTREGRLWWAGEHSAQCAAAWSLRRLSQFLHTLPSGTITLALRKDRMSEVEDGLFRLL